MGSELALHIADIGFISVTTYDSHTTARKDPGAQS